MNFIIETLTGIGNSFVQVLAVSWWFVLPLGLAFIFWDFWRYHVYVGYVRSQKWVVLEIKVPADIEKTPKAMEQVFASFYQVYSHGLKVMEKYWQGKLVEDFISCEIVGHAGGVHFYIRAPVQYRNIVESSVYSQYPGAEIQEAEDYLGLWPKTLPNQVYDIAGTDYELIKDSVYPIRTYEYFETNQEETRLDPISAITEVMSNLKEEESLWLQIFVRPVGPDWKKKGQEVINQLALRKKPAASSAFPEKVFHFFKNLLIALIEHPVWPEEEKKREDKTPSLMMLTPGERDVLEAVENKVSKIGFETNIRFLYIDRKDRFSPLNVAATMSTFNQYNDTSMNGFKPKIKTLTMTPAGFSPLIGFFATNIKAIKRRIVWFRKRMLWDFYKRLRWSSGKRGVLNIEELATLYHFPSIVVRAPLLKRLGTKKGEPPAGLPVE